MSAVPPTPERTETSSFEIDIYQLAADDMFLDHRPDCTGWDWNWADWKREWMEDSPSKFAYRCLPLTIANQIGWHVRNPVGFLAVWDGQGEPGTVRFQFDSDTPTWSRWINNQFGGGIITWNTPFLFRTKPAGSRLLVTGPANHFKHGLAPLTAVIESDWMSMSFTMNWKFTAPGVTIRFERGEPLLQVIPLASNVGADLERATVRYRKLDEDAEVSAAYHKWQAARQAFHLQKADGQVRADDWQKEYFQGRDVFGRQVSSGHTTR